MNANDQQCVRCHKTIETHIDGKQSGFEAQFCEECRTSIKVGMSLKERTKMAKKYPTVHDLSP